MSLVFWVEEESSNRLNICMYLDSWSSLSLSKVMEVICGSYRERSSSDLFQELNMFCRGSTEGAQEML